MQTLKSLNGTWNWIFAFVIVSAMAIACKTEGEKSAEPAEVAPEAAAPAAIDTTRKDTMPPIDTTATTRPDGRPAGSQ